MTLNTNVMNSIHLFLVISIFIFLIIVPPSYCDDRYEQLSACSSQYRYPCGYGSLNISYPFRGGKRPHYCGSNGFEIKCDQDLEYHFIEFATQKFRVLNISYDDRRMTIARAGLRDDYCPGIIIFRDIVFDKVHFKYAPNDRNLSFFHDCDEEISIESQNYFSCNVHGEVITGFYTIDTLQNMSNTCKEVIKVPVLLAALLPGHLGQVLKRGFDVEYNADNILCDKCLASRGICASNKSNSEQFICLCPDQSRPQACPLEHPHGLGLTLHRNMNNNHLFPTLTLHFIITIFFFLIVLPQSHCDDDEDQFSICSSSPYLYRCGSKELNISYPFWGGDRPQYCGHEGFKIECHNYGYHFIDFKTQKFGVLNIDASHRIMTIARDDLWYDYCPGIVTNDTVIDSSRFQYTPNVGYVSFFHDCDDQKLPKGSPNMFNCTVEGEAKAGFYTVKVDKPEPHLSNLTNTCNAEIKVPVLLSALDDLVRTVNLQKVLNKGFEVDYMAGDKLCAACNSSGGICGSNLSASSEPFLCFCRDHDEPQKFTCPPRPGRQPNKKMKAIIGVAAGFGGMIIMAVVSLIWVRYYRKKHAPSPYTSRNISSDPSSVADLEKADKFLGVHLFTYSELEVATNNFDSAKELGDGGFGTVYYGKLRDGRAVAVKRLYENNYKRVEQFMNEVEILADLRHRNLVTLYGCTSRHCRELLLVYEFVSNGTVADHLHGERAKPGALPWAIRLNIAIETASALQYLHASTIIHRDVKTNNILLDNNFCVKVADFGLSRLFPDHVTHVSTAPQGTPGYVDPEYHQCYQLTDKSDVFSFGVVLVELISSMPAVDITRHRHEINLSNLFMNKIQNKALHELVDPYLGFESDYKVRKMIYAVAELAFQCLQADKDWRPSMATVLETLKDIESDGYSKDKAEELDISDDVGLLKNGPPAPSPDSRTSTKTTPPTSN